MRAGSPVAGGSTARVPADRIAAGGGGRLLAVVGRRAVDGCDRHGGRGGRRLRRCRWRGRDVGRDVGRGVGRGVGRSGGRAWRLSRGRRGVGQAAAAVGERQADGGAAGRPVEVGRHDVVVLRGVRTELPRGRQRAERHGVRARLIHAEQRFLATWLDGAGAHRQLGAGHVGQRDVEPRQRIPLGKQPITRGELAVAAHAVRGEVAVALEVREQEDRDLGLVRLRLSARRKGWVRQRQADVQPERDPQRRRSQPHRRTRPGNRGGAWRSVGWPERA